MGSHRGRACVQGRGVRNVSMCVRKPLWASLLRVGFRRRGRGAQVSSDSADARYRRGYVHASRTHHRASRGARPPSRSRRCRGLLHRRSSSIVVDGNSGAVLQASNPDALRHPASLTKIMTLYLLFERLEAGRIKLDTPLKVSEHAAEQAPSKLELEARPDHRRSRTPSRPSSPNRPTT